MSLRLPATILLLASLFAAPLHATAPTTATKPTPLAPGDFLQITIPGFLLPDQDFTTQVRVSEAGTIRLQNVYKVNIAKLSTDQIAEEIAKRILSSRTKDDKRPVPKVSVKRLPPIDPPAAGQAPKVGAGDLVQVQIYELITPGLDCSLDIQIDELGDLRIPNFGTVNVSGLTSPEIQTLIEKEMPNRLFFGLGGPHGPLPELAVTLLQKLPRNQKPATFHPGDILHINAPQLMKQYHADDPIPVNPKGDIDIPTLGTLHAADLTPAQLREKIADQALAAGKVDNDAAIRLRQTIAVSWFSRTP